MDDRRILVEEVLEHGDGSIDGLSCCDEQDALLGARESVVERLGNVVTEKTV